MFRRFRTFGLAVFLIGVLLQTLRWPVTFQSVFADDGIVTYDVDTEGPRAGGDYYGSGNDNAFGEYGITTFNFTQADFGGPVLDITDIALTLTVHGRNFADGGTVEFFFSPDSGADLDSGGGDFSRSSSIATMTTESTLPILRTAHIHWERSTSMQPLSIEKASRTHSH